MSTYIIQEDVAEWHRYFYEVEASSKEKAEEKWWDEPRNPHYHHENLCNVENIDSDIEIYEKPNPPKEKPLLAW